MSLYNETFFSNIYFTQIKYIQFSYVLYKLLWIVHVHVHCKLLVCFFSFLCRIVTHLHMASAKGYSMIVEMLLKAGANRSSVNKVVIFTCRLTCVCTLLTGMYRQSFYRYTVFTLLF